VLLVMVGWLVFLWFAYDWGAPACDENADPVHCGQITGPGPGNGR
jgi:hypothetical protein